MVRSSTRRDFQFKPGDKISIESQYEILDRDGEGKSGPSGVARPIDSGDVGIIYRACFKNMERAIKILSPKEELIEQKELWEHFDHTFTREILFLSKITHTNLSKIMDYGEVPIGDKSYKYYVMEYISGDNIKDIWASCNNTEIFLKLWDNILSALECLHKNHVMHMDVKEENILVSKVGDVPEKATLVDLGASKFLDFENKGLFKHTQMTDSTYFFSTERITRPERRKYLRSKVSYSQLQNWFPDHDLFACGTILQGALKEKKLCEVISKEIGETGLHSFKIICNRLLGPEEQQYKSIYDLRHDIQKLRPGYLSPFGVAEISIATNVYKSIALTQQNRAALTKRMVQIIEHPLFQRLRNIPQLDFAYLLYPGAHHTRFLHSICTFNLAREYICNILNDSTFRLLIDSNDIEALMLWALLHDIGQYPLSHMFEDFAVEERLAKKPPVIMTDEDLFWSFINPRYPLDFIKKYSEIIEREFRNQYSGEKKLLWEIINEQFSQDTIESLIDLFQVRKDKYRVLFGLMSSPIDIDKVSYLLLDSEMTGVSYGMGIDLEALLSSLIVPSESDLKTHNGPLIGIKDKGLSAAESVVLARYWMLRRVYWHHANRALMAMCKFIVGSLLQLKILKFEEYFENTLFYSHTDALFYLSELFNRHKNILEDHFGREIDNPLKNIYGGNRQIYRRLVTVSHGPDEKEINLYNKLAFRRWTELDEIIKVIIVCLEKSNIEGTKSIKQSDILIDVPVKERERLGAEVLVYLQKEPTVGKILYSKDSVSPLMSAFREEFDRHVKKCRIYISPDLFEKLEPNIEKVRDIVMEVLQ
ncbi:MAG TPA: protein kinase [archaeon]|nr:protein kinase [archaeon]